MTYKWEVIINNRVFIVQGSNAWTATTRAIKLYWKVKGTLAALNYLDMKVDRMGQVKKP